MYTTQRTSMNDIVDKVREDNFWRFFTENWIMSLTPFSCVIVWLKHNRLGAITKTAFTSKLANRNFEVVEWGRLNSSDGNHISPEKHPIKNKERCLFQKPFGLTGTPGVYLQDNFHWRSAGSMGGGVSLRLNGGRCPSLLVSVNVLRLGLHVSISNCFIYVNILICDNNILSWESTTFSSAMTSQVDISTESQKGLVLSRPHSIQHFSWCGISLSVAALQFEK